MPFIYNHFDGFSALLVTGCKVYSWAQEKSQLFSRNWLEIKTIPRATAIFLIA